MAAPHTGCSIHVPYRHLPTATFTSSSVQLGPGATETHIWLCLALCWLPGGDAQLPDNRGALSGRRGLEPSCWGKLFVFRFSCGRCHPYPWVPHVTVMGTLAVLSWFAFGKIHPACVSFSQPHPCSVHSAGCQSSGRSWGGGGGCCFAV